MIDAHCVDCEDGRVTSSKDVPVDVPAGVDDQTNLRIQGKGAPGWAEAGDLVVHVRVEASRVFRRLDGPGDLEIEVPVSYPEAVLGGQVRIPKRERGQIALKVQPGTSSGKLLRVAGLGLPIVGGQGLRGDLYVRIMIAALQEPTKQALRLIGQLAAYDSPELRRGLPFEPTSVPNETSSNQRAARAPAPLSAEELAGLAVPDHAPELSSLAESDLPERSDEQTPSHDFES